MCGNLPEMVRAAAAEAKNRKTLIWTDFRQNCSTGKKKIASSKYGFRDIFLAQDEEKIITKKIYLWAFEVQKFSFENALLTDW